MYKEFVQRVICLTFFLNGTFLHSKNVTLILNPVDYYFFLSKVHKEKKNNKKPHSIGCFSVYAQNE